MNAEKQLRLAMERDVKVVLVTEDKHGRRCQTPPVTIDEIGAGFVVYLTGAGRNSWREMKLNKIVAIHPKVIP